MKESELVKMMKDYVYKTKDDWNYILPMDFYKNYYKNSKKDYFLLDLRKKIEFDKFHIEGAKNIFWLDLFDEKNLNKLPKDKTIFLICYVGHTSSQILTMLKMLGYKAVSLKFGYGISPAVGVPIAGWIQYKLPLVSSKEKLEKTR